MIRCAFHMHFSINIEIACCARFLRTHQRRQKQIAFQANSFIISLAGASVIDNDMRQKHFTLIPFSCAFFLRSPHFLLALSLSRGSRRSRTFSNSPVDNSISALMLRSAAIAAAGVPSLSLRLMSVFWLHASHRSLISFLKIDFGLSFIYFFCFQRV